MFNIAKFDYERFESPKRLNLKNQISNQWPSYMVGSGQKLYVEPNRLAVQKHMNVNCSVGQSADFPLKSSDKQVILANSKSLFSPIKRDVAQSQVGGAGLSNSNTVHGFICHNGKVTSPCIFANFSKNGVTIGSEEGQRLQRHFNHKILQQKIDAIKKQQNQQRKIPQIHSHNKIVPTIRIMTPSSTGQSEEIHQVEEQTLTPVSFNPQQTHVTTMFTPQSSKQKLMPSSIKPIMFLDIPQTSKIDQISPNQMSPQMKYNLLSHRSLTQRQAQKPMTTQRSTVKPTDFTQNPYLSFPQHSESVDSYQSHNQKLIVPQFERFSQKNNFKTARQSTTATHVFYNKVANPSSFQDGVLVQIDNISHLKQSMVSQGLLLNISKLEELNEGCTRQLQSTQRVKTVQHNNLVLKQTLRAHAAKTQRQSTSTQKGLQASVSELTGSISYEQVI